MPAALNGTAPSTVASLSGSRLSDLDERGRCSAHRLGEGDEGQIRCECT